MGLQSICFKKTKLYEETEVSRKLGSMFVIAKCSTFISVIILMAKWTTFSSQCWCVGFTDAVNL